MALTATATLSTKKKIFNLLEFVDPFEVVASPHRNNISFVVQKMENISLLDNFSCILTNIRKKGENTMRTIIYCQTILQCSLLYNSISNELGPDMYKDHKVEPSYRMVEMMHSQTPTCVKDHIIEQFSKMSGHLRVLIATIAYGMGVNCKGVRRVIHFGPSKSVESYIQESGRCGRQGEESYAILYNSITMRMADDCMKDYISGSYTCRRRELFKHFQGNLNSQTMPVGHNCCDKCAESCTCRYGRYCDTDVYLPVGDPNKELDTVNIVARDVTDEQRERLKSKLWQFHKQNIVKDSSSASHVTYPTAFIRFGEHQINEVLEHCHLLFTTEDILKHVQIWHKKYATMVLSIINDVFGDVNQETDNFDNDIESTDSESER